LILWNILVQVLSCADFSSRRNHHYISRPNQSINMADLSTCPPIDRSSVQAAHKRIEKYIHRTPIVTCETINQLASTPASERCPTTGPNVASEPAPHTKNMHGDAATSNSNPKVRLFFKCENQQRIGAFKARGAFHALGRLIEKEGIESVREKGVVTHSSGMVPSSGSLQSPRTNNVSQVIMHKPWH
jgi:threonine dehydratase